MKGWREGGKDEVTRYSTFHSVQWRSSLTPPRDPVELSLT